MSISPIKKAEAGVESPSTAAIDSIRRDNGNVNAVIEKEFNISSGTHLITHRGVGANDVELSTTRTLLKTLSVKDEFFTPLPCW